MENENNENKAYTEEIIGSMTAAGTPPPADPEKPRTRAKTQTRKKPAGKISSSLGTKAASARRKLAPIRKSRAFTLFYDKGIFYFLLSFLIPAGIMTYAFANAGMHPFGDRQMLVVDLWHQYFPFFRVVREKLLTHGSFFYSWKNGLGSNFLSLISYYAMSPLNIFSIFFNENSVRDALMFILIAKIGFSGAFFHCFLRYTYKRTDFSTCFFSVMYALSAYTLGYYWNVMWFDTVALFPLVMLGIVAICRERKWKTYTFALALSLISNYYIGYFTCIFSIFMFLAAGIIEFKGFKDWLYKCWLMLRSTVLGIGLGGFILLPAYFGLKLTYSNDERSLWKKLKDILSEKKTYYDPWKKIFANTISYNAPAKVEGLPNFACGMLALMLFGVFIFAIGIKIREKVASVAMLAIIVISCNMRQLYYIWHGFHFTNQIPYRFAFIFSFVLAASAYRAYDIILRKGVKVWQLVVLPVCPAVIIYLNYLVKGSDFHFTGAVRSSMILTLAMWTIFLAIKVFPFSNPAVRNSIMSLALAAAVCSEFVSNAKIGVDTVSDTGYYDYPTNYDAIESLLAAAKESDDSPFYRTEVTNTYTLNDSALYGYYGLSQFSSAANVSVTRLCRRLGLYASEAGNRYYYRTSTPVINSLFSIKYLIKKSGELRTDSYALDFVGNAKNCNMYRTKYPLSLGFMMDKKILSLSNKDAQNPFEYQNEILRAATGTNINCFYAQPVNLVEYTNMNVTKNGYGNYTFTSEDKNRNKTSALYTFAGINGSYLYGYASSTGGACDRLEIKCGSYVIDSGDLIDSYPLLFPMGEAQEGETSTIEISAADGKHSGNYRLMVYALNKQLYDEIYEKLADEQLEITDFSDKKIKGKINAKKSGVLYFSIPYEKGWTVYIDGKKADTCKVLDAMLGVKVEAGEHTVRLEYVPEGFTVGMIATVSSAVITGGLIWYERRRKKRKLAADTLQTTTSGGGPDGDGEAPEEEAPVIPAGEIYNQAVEELPAQPAAEAAVEAPEPEHKDTVSPEAQDEKPESDNSVQGD